MLSALLLAAMAQFPVVTVYSTPPVVMSSPAIMYAAPVMTYAAPVYAAPVMTYAAPVYSAPLPYGGGRTVIRQRGFGYRNKTVINNW